MRLSSAAPLLLSLAAGLDLPDYPGLRTDQSKPGVLQIAFNNSNSPINTWTLEALVGLEDIVAKLRNDTEIKAVVFSSDNPLFFTAHLDLTIQPFNPTIAQREVELCHNMTNLNQVTIGAVNGIARGAGNELLVSLDMRFAVKSHTRLGQPEIGLGLIPGGGGSQYLPRLIGRGRAMEYILTAKDIMADEAERIGWINKAFDSDAEMEAYIDDILDVLVLYDIRALGAAKRSINASSRPQLQDGIDDADAFLEAIARPETQALVGKFLEITANQSANEVELFFPENVSRLYE